MPTQMLSDKGLSIFTFAAYHELTSGEHVSEVTIHDGAGHSAHPDGVREVEALGLATVSGAKAVLSDSGRQLLTRVLEQIRGVAKHAERETATA